MGGLAPKKREIDFIPSASSLYQSAPLHIEPPPVLVGERTNANGSKQFRDLLAKEDWEGIVAMGQEAVKEGAHMVDVCAAYVGRDEARDMREIIFRFNTQVTLPIVIDSTEAPVIEEALQLIGGKAIVNSINLEDGEERDQQGRPALQEVRRRGHRADHRRAGDGKDRRGKLAVARRIYDLVVGKYGMRPHDLIFDTLTFTLGSGDEEFRRAGIETLNGDPADQEGVSGGQDAARRQQHLVRALPAGPACAEQRLPSLCHRSRTRHGDRPRVQDHAPLQDRCERGESSAGS